jgi:DNA-binding transcriptional LysR family regulator
VYAVTPEGALLLASKIDLAILTKPAVSTSMFNLEPWRREPLTAFVRSAHPFAERKTVELLECEDVRLVIRIRKEGQSRTERVLGALVAKGARIKTIIGCESSESVKEIVRHGAAVGILFYDALKREIEMGVFKTIRITGLEAWRQSYIAYPKDRSLSAYAREFLVLLRASMPEDSPPKTMPPGTSNLTVPSPRRAMLRA